MHFQPHHVHEPVGSPEFCVKIAISAVLVLAGGVFAGYALPSPPVSAHPLPV